MTNQPASSVVLPTCPICGSATRIAFPKSTAYVTCTRNGHVTQTESD